MANEEKIKELLKNLTTGLSQNAMEKVVNMIPMLSKKGVDLSKMQVPFLTNDKNVEKFINEFQLRDPQKLIRFMVEWHFATLEHFSADNNDIKVLDIINSCAFVKSAKMKYNRALDNENDKKYYLLEASNNLDMGISQLGEKAIFYIDKIREIDNRKQPEFFFKALLSLININTFDHCAKLAIELTIEAIKLQIAIAGELNHNIKSEKKIFEDFKHSVLKDDNYLLMHAYAPKANKDFWHNLPNLLDKSIETVDLLNDLKGNDESEDFNFDDIKFNLI